MLKSGQRHGTCDSLGTFQRLAGGCERLSVCWGKEHLEQSTAEEGDMSGLSLDTTQVRHDIIGTYVGKDVPDSAHWLGLALVQRFAKAPPSWNEQSHRLRAERRAADYRSRQLRRLADLAHQKPGPQCRYERIRRSAAFQGSTPRYLNILPLGAGRASSLRVRTSMNAPGRCSSR